MPNTPALTSPCLPPLTLPAPPTFTLTFPTTAGPVIAHCERGRAPTQADRVFQLAVNGYYDENYFFRVLNNGGREGDGLDIVQFGTSGDPVTSIVYNYTTTASDCGIIEPQPPFMRRCMLNDKGSQCDEGVTPLSNTWGTLSMSTSGTNTADYPDGVTWNATAELFFNTGDNARLDEMLFVPICTIDKTSMENVAKFQSVGEVQELGGNGISLGELYEKGNGYERS